MARKVQHNEEWFNAQLRAVLRGQGLSCMHVRETEKPGAADLPVWRGAEIVGWLELKVGDHDLDPQQREFLRDRDAECGAAFVVRYRTDPILVTVERGSNQLWTQTEVVAEIIDWRLAPWQQMLWRLRRDGLRYK